MTVLKPCALDFAQLLHARQELETQARLHLTELQAQIRAMLEQRGYREVALRPLPDSPSQAEAAAETTVVVLARLPLDGLKAPVFRVQLPLVVTYSGQLVVQRAQINKLMVPQAFVQAFPSDPAQTADNLIQFLSEKYMEYLLQAVAGQESAFGPAPAEGRADRS